MPDSRCDDAGKRHWQYEFPGKIHDLINPRTWQRSAKPDVNEEQRAQLREKPDIRGYNFKRARGRMPATEKQSRGEPGDGEHPDILRHEESCVFEPGIFGHVAGNNFRFTFGHIEWSAI